MSQIFFRFAGKFKMFDFWWNLLLRHFGSRMHRNQNFENLTFFPPFLFSLSFFSFAILFAAVIGLLPGLLGVKNV